jgi:hypothetical protein
VLRYLPLLAYPLLPAVAGVLLATSPMGLGDALLVLLFGLAWKGGRKQLAKRLALPGLPAGFPGPIAALCVASLLTQAVAAFLLGMGLVASWRIVWLLPYALLPSLVLAAALEMQRRRLR